MSNYFERTKILLGEEAINRLKKSSVAVFGVGGVGSFAAEALARSAVGCISLFDKDVVSATNINRQLIATTDTIGREKVEVMAKRIKQINPDAKVNAHYCFYDKDSAGSFDLSEYHYIVDAIDTISSKLLLIENAKKARVPIISSMGAGNKLDATKFEVADIFETSVCPLARVMRKELKARGITSLKVVYSKEPAIKPLASGEECPPGKRQLPGSVAFVPPVAGLIIAGEVVKDICFN